MGIIEFAKLAGVSIATVSRAFTGRGRISKKTSERILKLAAKNGFTPNINASRLSLRESGSIGLIVVLGRDSPRHGEIRELTLDVSSAILESGYSVNLMVSANPKDRMLQRMITGGGVDGVLLAAEEIQPAASIRGAIGDLPCVLLEEGISSEIPGVGVVTTASREAVAGAVGRLTQLGHRRIAWIDDGCDGEKFVGYKKGLYQAGIPFEADLVERTGGRFEEGSLAIRKLLARRQFNAIIAASDLLALGAMAALQDTGRKVSGDVSVVGFGDLEISRCSNPPLTTLHINRREMGLLAMSILMEMIRERKKAKRAGPPEIQQRWLRSITPVLIERGSTAPNQRVTTQFHRHE